MGRWYAGDAAAECGLAGGCVPLKAQLPQGGPMRLDLRIAVPAALAVAAFAIPSSSSADPPMTGNCPDGYIIMSSAAMPSKDRNGDGFVCMKVNPSGPV